ncbi:MAG: nucleoside 2-deoxyribosyltransferase domain-containing protein [Chitinophagales bacterium]|nr:nucleoside 2-deoxyribosyltransferase domain-containing protein [Chitinophagales bacterium]
MKVIKPPHSISKNHKKGQLIFLAGSIDMGQAEHWQAQVENYFKDSNTYTILNPRRDNWDSSWEQKFESPNFSQQVNWELNGLERSDIIILYLSPDTKSPISLLELGLFARSGKLLVCCPNGFWRKGNVDIVCEKYNIPLFEDLENLLKINFPESS